MNVFQSNSVPFLLALIVSALGWYVGQINSDIRNTKVATYQLEADPGTPHARVTIENVSRTETLANMQIVLACPAHFNAARRPANGRDLVTPTPIQPIRADWAPASPGEMGLFASLAPGGAIGVDVTLAECDSAPLEFYVRPGDGSPFLLLKAGSLRGWMARNYVDALPIVFLVMLMLFLLWLIVSLLFWWRKRDERAVAGNVHHVHLFFGDSGEPGATDDDADQGRGERTGDDDRHPE